MKRKVIIGLLCVTLAAATAGLLNYNNNSFQDNISLERSDKCLGEFPIINGLITPSRLMSFLVDSGSDLSMITPATVNMLKEHGYRVDSTMCVVAYRDNRGDLRFATKRYSIDIPLNSWTVSVSDDGQVFYKRGDKDTNIIHNVNFIPATDNVNIFGIDFLKNFAVEYKVDYGTIRLHTSTPEGYEKLHEIHTKSSPYGLLGCSNRYYMDMTIAGQTNSYFIDTALDLVNVKQPSSDTIHAHNHVYDKSVINAQGDIMLVKSSDQERTCIGDRLGLTDISYYNDGDDLYALNAFKFSRQDVLVDFPKQQICFHPHFDVVGYPGGGVSKK